MAGVKSQPSKLEFDGAVRSSTSMVVIGTAISAL
jgi:hypothetical protein